MKPTNSNSISYIPGAITSSTTKISDLQANIIYELNMVGAAIAQLAEGHIDTTYVTPPKPRDGDIRLADGTHWNPGKGKGLYVYYNSTWNKLITEIRLPIVTTAPSSPVSGDIILVENTTSWNPGSGPGVYCYYNSVWNFL